MPDLSVQTLSEDALVLLKKDDRVSNNLYVAPKMFHLLSKEDQEIAAEAYERFRLVCGYLNKFMGTSVKFSPFWTMNCDYNYEYHIERAFLSTGDGYYPEYLNMRTLLEVAQEQHFRHINDPDNGMAPLDVPVFGKDVMNHGNALYPFPHMDVLVHGQLATYAHMLCSSGLQQEHGLVSTFHAVAGTARRHHGLVIKRRQPHATMDIHIHLGTNGHASRLQYCDACDKCWSKAFAPLWKKYCVQDIFFNLHMFYNQDIKNWHAQQWRRARSSSGYVIGVRPMKTPVLPYFFHGNAELENSVPYTVSLDGAHAYRRHPFQDYTRNDKKRHEARTIVWVKPGCRRESDEMYGRLNGMEEQNLLQYLYEAHFYPEDLTVVDDTRLSCWLGVHWRNKMQQAYMRAVDNGGKVPFVPYNAEAFKSPQKKPDPCDAYFEKQEERDKERREKDRLRKQRERERKRHDKAVAGGQKQVKDAEAYETATPVYMEGLGTSVEVRCAHSRLVDSVTRRRGKPWLPDPKKQELHVNVFETSVGPVAESRVFDKDGDKKRSRSPSSSDSE